MGCAGTAACNELIRPYQIYNMFNLTLIFMFIYYEADIALSNIQINQNVPSCP
jgi:hypothetical protein